MVTDEKKLRITQNWIGDVFLEEMDSEQFEQLEGIEKIEVRKRMFEARRRALIRDDFNDNQVTIEDDQLN